MKIPKGLKFKMTGATWSAADFVSKKEMEEMSGWGWSCLLSDRPQFEKFKLN